MFQNSLWMEPLYRETVAVLIAFLFLIASILFFIRNKNIHTSAIWASLKSWIFFTPFLFFIFAFKEPWQLVLLVVFSIYACKVFFQMVGMYHRSWFIWTTYAYLILTGLCILKGYTEIYNILPMIFLGTVLLIPLLRNSAKHMIQYMSLSMMAFVFFGWSFLHLGRILELDMGVYIVIYLYILAEISENTSLVASTFFNKFKLFNKITSRLSVEGLVISTFFTVLVAWGMRHLLPYRSELFWLSSGLTVAIIGHLGQLFIAVIRRDLGIKSSGIFILGRGDIVDRLDKLIFIGPVFYYTFKYLEKGLL